MTLTDITDEAEYGWADGEYLPITRCKCGAKFVSWDFFISIYEDWAEACPKCGRKMIWRSEITIYEV